MKGESCDECTFDRASYTRADLLGTLRALAPMWRATIEGVDEDVLHRRPDPETWSTIEYVGHSRDITAAMGWLVHQAVTHDDALVDEPPPEPPDPDTPATATEAIAELEANAARVGAKAKALAEDEWDRVVTVGTDPLTVDWLVGHAVHDAVHHLRDAGRVLHALGAGVASQRGSVAQVSARGGGVPKAALPSAEINRSGVVGDTQADRANHGRPLQALCLWSADVIDALRGEGHPVEPGAAGENITVSGIDWAGLRPGARLLIGDVLVEISAHATPCAKNAEWFADGDFRRIDHARHPGWSRLYAWVLEGGSVSPGDQVLVEP